MQTSHFTSAHLTTSPFMLHTNTKAANFFYSHYTHLLLFFCTILHFRGTDLIQNEIDDIYLKSWSVVFLNSIPFATNGNFFCHFFFFFKWPNSFILLLYAYNRDDYYGLCIPLSIFDGLSSWGMGFPICPLLMTHERSGLAQDIKLYLNTVRFT